MNQNALMVIADEPGTFHWVLLNVDGRNVESHSQSDCEFNDYQSALDAGSRALATLDEQPFEGRAAASTTDSGIEPAARPANGEGSMRDSPGAS